MNYSSYEEKDWSKDANTSNLTAQSVYRNFNYGNSIFEQLFFGDKLIFSGAETSPVCGGYMDGAIYSGLLSVKQLLR